MNEPDISRLIPVGHPIGKRLHRYVTEQPHFFGQLVRAFFFLAEDHGYLIHDAVSSFTMKRLTFMQRDINTVGPVIIVTWELGKPSRARIGRPDSRVPLPPGAAPLALHPAVMLQSPQMTGNSNALDWSPIAPLADAVRDQLPLILARLDLAP